MSRHLPINRPKEKKSSLPTIIWHGPIETSPHPVFHHHRPFTASIFNPMSSLSFSRPAPPRTRRQARYTMEKPDRPSTLVQPNNRARIKLPNASSRYSVAGASALPSHMYTQYVHTCQPGCVCVCVCARVVVRWSYLQSVAKRF